MDLMPITFGGSSESFTNLAVAVVPSTSSNRCALGR